MLFCSVQVLPPVHPQSRISQTLWQPAYASWSNPTTSQPEHSHQPEQPGKPVHAPGDAPGAAGQRHKHGALAGWFCPLSWMGFFCTLLVKHSACNTSAFTDVWGSVNCFFSPLYFRKPLRPWRTFTGCLLSQKSPQNLSLWLTITTKFPLCFGSLGMLCSILAPFTDFITCPEKCARIWHRKRCKGIWVTLSVLKGSILGASEWILVFGFQDVHQSPPGHTVDSYHTGAHGHRSTAGHGRHYRGETPAAGHTPGPAVSAHSPESDQWHGL